MVLNRVMRQLLHCTRAQGNLIEHLDTQARVSFLHIFAGSVVFYDVQYCILSDSHLGLQVNLGIGVGREGPDARAIASLSLPHPFSYATVIITVFITGVGQVRRKNSVIIFKTFNNVSIFKTYFSNIYFIFHCKSCPL